MRIALTLIASLLITASPVPADVAHPETDAPPEATQVTGEPGLMELLRSATEDQRARTLRFLGNRYPDLATELFAVLQSRHPGIFIALDRELQDLVATRYPRLSATVQRLLHEVIADHYPQVRHDVNRLIADNYPELLDAMYSVGEGDPAVRVARLVRERHRALLDDVLSLLRERYPALLTEVQHELLVKHPELLADVADLIAQRYPDISHEVSAVLAAKYPELIPGIMAILAPPPAEGEPEGPADQ